MTFKRTNSTARVANERPRVNELDTKLKVVRDYESGKSVLVIARQSGMSQSHSTIATVLNKNQVTEAVKGSASLKATRLTQKFEKGLYQI
jgi:hypothetical protein